MFLLVVDSLMLPFERPVSLGFQEDGMVIAQLNGNIWKLEDDSMYKLVHLEQPVFHIDTDGTNIAISHDRSITILKDTLELESFVGFISGNAFSSVLCIMESLIYVISYKLPKDFLSGNMFVLDVSQGTFFPYAYNLGEPLDILCLDEGIWLMSRKEGNVAIYPIYEGLDYTNISPFVVLDSLSIAFVKLLHDFLVGTRNGKFYLYKRIKDNLYKRFLLLETTYEPVDMHYYRDTLYFLDYVSGNLYKAILNLQGK